MSKSKGTSVGADSPWRAPRVLGILGGMGPMAGLDLAGKIISLTPARCDQEHLPMLLASLPQIPSRVAALTGEGASPVPAMLDALGRLARAGAHRVAIACNTAHAWWDELSRASPVPLFNLIDIAVAALPQDDRVIGVLATAGTCQAGLYERALRLSGRVPLCPDWSDQRRLVDEAIDLVKAGHLDRAAPRFELAARHLREAGAQCILLACTEVPLGFAALAPPARARSLDASLALAAACVCWSMGGARGEADGDADADVGTDADASVDAAPGPQSPPRLRHNEGHGSKVA